MHCKKQSAAGAWQLPLRRTVEVAQQGYSRRTLAQFLYCRQRRESTGEMTAVIVKEQLGSSQPHVPLRSSAALPCEAFDGLTSAAAVQLIPEAHC
jgi:hypothetical protein